MFLFDYKISENKKLEFALRECMGFGMTQSKRVIGRLGLNLRRQIKIIQWAEIYKYDLDLRLQDYITYLLRIKVGIDRKNINIIEMKKLKEVFTYRALRHLQRLPVRGQGTKTNARTQKAKRGVKKRLPVATKKKK